MVKLDVVNVSIVKLIPAAACVVRNPTHAIVINAVLDIELRIVFMWFVHLMVYLRVDCLGLRGDANHGD